MLNIERYKDELSKDLGALDCQICALRKKGNCNCGDYCDECRVESIKWLCSEYKEQILDEVEKEYLSAVIKPFRDKVASILKGDNGLEFIRISVEYDGSFRLPCFKKGSMYKNMKTNKKYKLEELGL